MKSILLDEKLLGLAEMTSGLVNASFSLPELQAVKMIFFAPCCACANTYVVALTSENWVDIERFSLDCHKTKTKVNTLANQRA